MPEDSRRTAGPGTVIARPRAKINVFLRVLGRRPDGFHDLESLVVPVSLTDRLQIHAFADPGQFRTLSLSLDLGGDPALVAGVPRDESNLVLRAAAALAERVGARGFAELTLEKRIPSAAGLGGGSADAAATLIALNDLWGCALSPAGLSEVGASVGSDVPALLSGGPAVIRGRGERVQPVLAPSQRWVLCTFPFEVRTADAFRWWDEDSSPTGPGPRPVIDAAARGDPHDLGRKMFNDLEAPVTRRHPAIAEAKERLLAAGAVGAVMCGSGPTVAALIPGGADVPVPGVIEVLS